MNNTSGQQIQILASTNAERSDRLSKPVIIGGAIGIATIALSCAIPFENQPNIQSFDCSNGSSDITSIKAKLNSSPDDLKKITEYNIGLKNIGVSVDNPSTIVTRFEGVNKENNGGFVEMAVSQAPLGGSEDLGTQTIVSFKSEEGTLEAFSFNPADDTNLIVREVPASGNTVVFFAGRSFGGDTGTTMFMQLNFNGSVTQDEVIELLSKGDRSRISKMVVLNPLTNTCCVVANNSQLNEQKAGLEFLREIASLNTDAGAPIVGNSESATPAPSTESPTHTPLPTATESPSRNALLGLGYTDAELKVYPNISEGTYSFPGDTVIYHGIIGTKADGSKEILAFKFSGIPNLIKLSGTELANYAKEARKNPISGSCFEKYYAGNQRDPGMDINSVSTGVIIQFEKDVGGKKIIFKTGLMATQTDQGIPVPFLTILQMEDAANPGIDLLEDNFFWASGLTPTMSTQVHSVEEWKGIIPQGKHIKPGIRYVIPSDSPRIEGLSLFRDEFADENYSKALQLFLDNHGSKQTGDLMIVLPWSVVFTE